MVSLSAIQDAQTRLRNVANRTRLIEFKLCAEDPRRLFLKPENQQPIGAFKLRGAYNKIASLSPEERKRIGFGVIVFLIAFAGILFAAYRKVWKDQH